MMTNKLEENESAENLDFKTLEPWQVDRYIEIVRENNEKIKKFKEIAKKRKLEIDNKLKLEEEKVDRENHFLLTTLNSFAKSQDDLRSTKTQYKYESLAGDVIIKKSLPKTTPPSKDKYEDIEEVYPEFVEDVTTKKVKWGELKRNLIIQDGEIYDKNSGEKVSHLFNMEISEEKTEVK